MLSIGILREYKTPEDIRVPLTPSQCAALLGNFTDLSITVEPYAKRCFKDAEYEAAGVQVSNDLSHCDVLLGVKEVPKERLLEDKVYFFFSHTIKKQDYNLELMRILLRKRISMIDHETLTEANGQRIIGFGRWAGIVGAHYALLMIGKKRQLFDFKPASECHDMEAMLAQYEGVNFPNVKIALTGSGRVGRGAVEVLENAGIERVAPKSYLNDSFDHAVYTVLDTEDLYRAKDGQPVVAEEFYAKPANAVNGFTPYTKVTDVLINGIYWDFRAPILFQKEEIHQEDFKISMISDITCDVEGSVPITLRQTAIETPYIGIDKLTGEECTAFSPNSIDVMAVGNLPNELPRDASTDFGDAMANRVVPELFNIDTSELLQRAMICKNGALTNNFEYLREWVEQGN